jgi:hypothetical protein
VSMKYCRKTCYTLMMVMKVCLQARKGIKKFLQLNWNRYYLAAKKVSTAIVLKEVVLIMANGIKIHEIKRHTFISFLVAVICLIIGFQYVGAAETRETGVIAIVFGVLTAIAAIYMFFTPMIILGDDSIYFKSGNVAKKELPYSEIAAWTLQGDKHLIFKLKSDKEETDAEKNKNTLTINYCNIDKNNQKKLIDQLNIKGIERVITVEPKKVTKK